MHDTVPMQLAHKRSHGPSGAVRVLAILGLLLCGFITGTTCAADAAPNLLTAGDATVLSVRGEGVQLYNCAADTSGKLTWQFREPLATLIFNGKTVGRHFAGPTWEFADRSAVVAKVVSQQPGATKKDLALLKLEVVDHQGSGALSKVISVQRLNTRGGVFSGACTQAGAIHVEPYSADYLFTAE
ncbi:DUF3455 domain-containing protein [Pseudomonas gingeri]